MATIAIVHFTAPPAIGGVEGLIAVQCAVLTTLGFHVRLIVGAGRVDDVETRLLPHLLPSHPDVAEARAALSGRMPGADHPLVQEIARELNGALAGCTQCWVHNAYTIDLNPFLTAALLSLGTGPAGLRWIAWCHDISAVSTYHAPVRDDARTSLPARGMQYVTISEARQRELAALLAVDAESIAVVPVPLDPLWLSTGPEASRVARALHLEGAEPVLVVPAKLLPHKNLELAVHLAATLKRYRSRPIVMVTGAESAHEGGSSQRVRARLRREASRLDATDAFFLLSDVLGTEPAGTFVRDLMLLSDLVLLTSAEEGFGVPLLEAAALRVPVLCSDIPPFREVAGEWARLFPLDIDPDHLARMALELAGAPAAVARRTALQSSGRFRAEMERLASQ